MQITAILLLVIAFLSSTASWSGTDALTGNWRADLKASILPAGFPRLRSQTMQLEQAGDKLRCVTERVTIADVKTRAEFTGAFDGKHYPVTGMPEISSVLLQRYPDFIEADFFSGQTTVFSYRLWVSNKGDTLTVISIDPTTRTELHARILYRRAPVAR